jgi:hypothetical protein
MKHPRIPLPEAITPTTPLSRLSRVQLQRTRHSCCALLHYITEESTQYSPCRGHRLYSILYSAAQIAGSVTGLLNIVCHFYPNNDNCVYHILLQSSPPEQPFSVTVPYKPALSLVGQPPFRRPEDPVKALKLNCTPHTTSNSNNHIPKQVTTFTYSID